jgi:sporulation protein YlmC with PRC-barrel domain
MDEVTKGMSESGQANRTTSRTQAGSARSEEGARIEGQPKHAGGSAGPGPRLMTADTLEGNDVVNRAGEELGEITDIMLDAPRGRIAYAVMSSGGFLRMGDKLFAIPWSALTLDTDGKCFILDVSAERLKQAPGFDKDRWPSTADDSFARQTHSYYGTRPYWE